MFCASSGVTANIAMVPKFEETAKNRRGDGKKGGAGEFRPELRLTKG
jgi:hypothetical protein